MAEDFINIVLTTRGTKSDNLIYSNKAFVTLTRPNCIIYTTSVFITKRTDPEGPLPPSGNYLFQIELINILPSVRSGNGTSAKLLISFVTFVDTAESVVQYVPPYPPSTRRRMLQISDNTDWYMTVSDGVPNPHPLLPTFNINLECAIIVPASILNVPSALDTRLARVTRKDAREAMKKRNTTKA